MPLVLPAKAIDATKTVKFGEGSYPLWTRRVPVDALSTISNLSASSKYQLQFADLMSTTDNTFR